jgi:hypothetical protein
VAHARRYFKDLNKAQPEASRRARWRNLALAQVSLVFADMVKRYIEAARGELPMFFCSLSAHPLAAVTADVVAVVCRARARTVNRLDQTGLSSSDREQA